MVDPADSPMLIGRGTTPAKAFGTPAPDDSRKPQSPQELKTPIWKYALKRSVNEFSRDKCTDLAAGLTYFAVLSLFPALLAILSLLGVVGQAENTSRTILHVLEGFASKQMVESLRGPVEQLASAPSAGFALVIGLAGAIWSASRYVRGFGRAMNQIYEVEEGRPFYKLNPVMLLVTLVMLLLAVVMAILLIVSGPLARSIGDAVGLGGAAVTVWTIAKWPVLVAFAIVLIAVLYSATPNVKQPRFRWMSIGSFVALLLLAVASLGFFFYVSNFANYNKTYGAVGGMIVLLLWLWIVNLSLLFGAEFDAELERGRELQAGVAAEDEIQLQPRDTQVSDKHAAQADEEIRAGRVLRDEHGYSRDGTVERRSENPPEQNHRPYPGRNDTP